MKMVSRLALAAALSLGAVAMTATPAVAQSSKKDKKKKGEPEAPQQQISAEYRKPAAAAETAIAANDWATAATELAKAEALATSDDEKYYASAMRLQIEWHNKSSEGVAKATDALLANPKTPPEKLHYYNYLRADAAFKLKKRTEALPYLLKARELGSKEEDIPLMIAQIYFDAGQIDQGAAEMQQAIEAKVAAGNPPSEDWYKFVIARYYNAGNRDKAAEWMVRRVSAYPTIENWRQVLVQYRDSVDKGSVGLDRAEKIELFRLMRASKALADQTDYSEYSKYAFQAGLPWEAMSVIEEGRAAKKIPSPSADFDKTYGSAKTSAANEGSLESIAKMAKTGKDAVATGDGFLASGSYQRAVEMYDQGLAKGGVETDVVQLHRGIALYHLGRKDEAKQAFELVKTGPIGDIAGFWLAWIERPASAA